MNVPFFNLHDVVVGLNDISVFKLKKLHCKQNPFKDDIGCVSSSRLSIWWQINKITSTWHKLSLYWLHPEATKNIFQNIAIMILRSSTTSSLHSKKKHSITLRSAAIRWLVSIKIKRKINIISHSLSLKMLPKQF